MNEDKKIFCTQCGGENNANAKFCSNCGSKLEQPASSIPEEAASSNVYQDGIFSEEDTSSPYERITDAEEVKPEGMPAQEEIQINDEIQINYGYSQNGNGFNENPVYSAGTPYYSGEDAAANPTGGYIGISIASLVCGILSLICCVCCLTFFGLVLSVAAIALGIIAIVKKYDGRGMAIAGIAVGGVAIVMNILMFVIMATGSYSSAWKDFANEFIKEFNY